MRSNALDVIDRLSGSAGYQGGTGRRNRRYDRWRPGALDERGIAQAHVADCKSADLLHLHKSNPRKNWRDVWKPGDHSWRKSVKVLRQYAGRYPPIGAIKQTDGVVTGNRTRVKVVKNKVAPPFTEAEFDIMYNEGISSVGALLDVALEQQVIEKRGSWLNYKGTQLAQGRDAAKEALKNDTALYDEIEAIVKSKLDEEKR